MDDDTVSSSLAKLTINTKVVTKYFNPGDYFRNGEMSYKEAATLINRFTYSRSVVPNLQYALT